MATYVRSIADGLLVTLEGIEGGGKAAQARALADRLEAEGYQVTLTREPGGTSVGEALQPIICRRGPAVGPWTELFLFAASRAHHVDQVIRPALERGEVVICSRFTDSTLAYQGYGRGLDLELVHIISHIASGGLRPHLTIILDLPPEQSLERSMVDGLCDETRQEELAFRQRSQQGYLQMATQEPRRFRVVDACLPPQEIAHQVWHWVQPLLAEAGSSSRRQPMRREVNY